MVLKFLILTIHRITILNIKTTTFYKHPSLYNQLVLHFMKLFFSQLYFLLKGDTIYTSCTYSTSSVTSYVLVIFNVNFDITQSLTFVYF